MKFRPRNSKPVPRLATLNIPNLQIRLRSLLDRQRTLTAACAGITGSEDFSAEERHYYGLQLEKIQYEIRHLQQEAKRG